MPGRLLEGFEQRVESLAGEHVDFVNDVDLAAGLRGRHAHFFLEVAHIVNAAVGCGVNLDHIEQLVFGDGRAHGACVAGRGGGAGFAVDALGHDARGAGFAGAARPAEQVGVRDSAAFDGVAQGGGHMFLPHDFIEVLGPVFAVK